MSGEQGSNQRRTMLVDRTTQFRMVRRLCLVPGIGLAAMGGLVIVALVCLQMEAQATNEVLPSLPLLIWSVVLFVGGTAGFLFVTSFRFSYRVAGPTYRILKSLEDFHTHGGEFNVKLRAGDELQDLASKLNEVMHELQAEPYDAPEPQMATASSAD